MTRSIHNAEDLARLPQWAQSQITSLIRDNGELRSSLGQGPDNSDTYMEGWHTHPNRPLGRRPTINFGITSFKTATGDHSNPIFQARYESNDPPTLHVSSYHGRLVVLPEATNAFRVQVTR